MKQDTVNINLWNEAAKYGIILGVLPAIYLFYGHLQIAMDMTGFFSFMVGIMLWAVKFFGCMMLMKHAMLKFAFENESVSKNDIFKFGVCMAIFSALVFSVISLADQLYFFPEQYQNAYAVLIEEYSKVLPAEQVDELKGMLSAPKFAFIGVFLYCLIYGTVLSKIFSVNIPSQKHLNPKNDEQ